MLPVDLAAPPPRRDLRAQQKRQTAVNVLLLLAFGTAVTVLVMRGVLPVVPGMPSCATLVAETVAYVLLFDAYFYVLHRLLHTRLAFRRVHVVHHRARRLDLWATIAMHPLEFTLVIVFLPVTMWLLPAHLVSIGVVGMFLSGSIMLAHCGREVFSSGWDRTPLLNLYLTPRIHAAHHARMHCNYGATVTLFDRLFGTLRLG